MYFQLQRMRITFEVANNKVGFFLAKDVAKVWAITDSLLLTASVHLKIILVCTLKCIYHLWYFHI